MFYVMPNIGTCLAAGVIEHILNINKELFQTIRVPISRSAGFRLLKTLG
jgi:hypothetical protein